MQITFSFFNCTSFQNLRLKEKFVSPMKLFIKLLDNPYMIYAY